MASVENTSNHSKSGSSPESGSPVPPVFHPPRASMRGGRCDSLDQSSKRFPFYPSSMENVYLKEKFMGRGQQNNGGNHLDDYNTNNDDMHYKVYQQTERREGGPTLPDDIRSEGHHYYSYSREGPSPGRGYAHHYPPVMQEYKPRHSTQMYYPSQMEQNLHQSKQLSSIPVRGPTSSYGKRKIDPLSPEGPRLISNQSSDDSISALLPPKRARSSNGFSDPVSLMKSFTPLSPIHSRTFSRDETMDMARFIDSRGSDGLRIFQSWSSGNSPPHEDQSSLDVRLCYNDWQGSGRRASSSRLLPDEGKLPSIKERENDHKSCGSRTPTTRPSKGAASPSQERWSVPIPRQPSFSRSHSSQGEKHLNPPTSYGMIENYNDIIENSRHCQPLHPEDRFPPFNDHLLRRFPAYNRALETRYWHGERNYQQGGPVARYGNQVDMKGDSHRGTPPMANNWNRYDDFTQTGPIYDKKSVATRPSQFGVWPDNRTYREIPVGAVHHPHHEPMVNEYVGRHLQSAVIESGSDGTATAMKTASGILLLSLPEDKISLSETLCIVRENIEVFIATEADVKAPAPGRKRPVVIGQVGLRCIHCRNATHQSEKVKRAVCFPSSIKRIYRTVIDMKLDHFKACRFVPIDLKMKLEQLKATNARSTGTTMQYFVSAAKRMGMVDGSHGIRLCKDKYDSIHNINEEPSENVSTQKDANEPNHLAVATATEKPLDLCKRRSLEGIASGVSFSLSLEMSMSGTSSCSTGKMSNMSISNNGSLNDDIPTFEGKTILACPEDRSALSPLRCFLRENVYAFSATAEDIAVRTPTTFSVVVGQVGIGCVHCHNLPAKERSNRAVCFPFSIGRIYQAVADIQRFHLGDCKMVPQNVREKFLQLQSASTKGSKGLATRQYWISSAKKIGLVDTSNGIRFSRDPCAPIEKAKSLDILAQVATDATTSSKPLVLPEDESQIAGFIYLVMKQLQPCRFTEADRNKRRLKDVGCIGVECKHCAGQVDGRKFFWSSVSAVESNFVSVHTHMMECKAISKELKEELAHLKTLRKEHTARLKTGSQKAFFARVWERLHAEDTGSEITTEGHRSEPTHNALPPHIDVPSVKPSVFSVPGINVQYSNMSSPSNSFSENVDLVSKLSPGSSKLRNDRILVKAANQLPMLPPSLTNMSAGKMGSHTDESAGTGEANDVTSV